ncbi:hypothetical protein H4R22_001830 [Coemansia sp. RSA 1290]|nr:hypothetical protein H4R22_001830 [Coemansia sp. RSA 1290]KAJ2652714.1 hypothetical protein IWW40_000825 [Coemansia sp. RSA 1250]KAJ2675320.1 hypothetical protein IWW42_001104 [Coemansia sp. RSA 1085]
MKATNKQLYDAVVAELEYIASSGTFGSDIYVTVEQADAQERKVVFRTSALLDEGWVATIADVLTSILVSVCTGTISHASTSLSASVLRRLDYATDILIECSVNSALQPPCATAVFRDARDSRIIYAAASHSKFIKPSLIASL